MSKKNDPKLASRLRLVAMVGELAPNTMRATILASIRDISRRAAAAALEDRLDVVERELDTLKIYREILDHAMPPRLIEEDSGNEADKWLDSGNSGTS